MAKRTVYMYYVSYFGLPLCCPGNKGGPPIHNTDINKLLPLKKYARKSKMDVSQLRIETMSKTTFDRKEWPK